MESADKPSRRGAVLFDVDAPAKPAPTAAPVRLDSDRPIDPAAAPPVPDDVDAPTPSGRAMQTIALLGARRERPLAKWFFAALGALLSFAVSLAAWNFVTGLIASNPILGYVALALVAVFVGISLLVALREVVALSRLGRIDGLRHQAEAVQNLQGARALAGKVVAFYGGRADTRWGRQEVLSRLDDAFDADAVLAGVERDLLAPLDAAAAREVEAAARQVALVTAVVPLALADVVAAMTSNLRMIRRIALIYGGRAGTLGSWRLTRVVLTHLAATGAVAVGDDLIQSVAGGGVLAKVSRRFGEGLVNGALTARVGLAAMEVCRPLPFQHQSPPRITTLVQRSLTGLFGQKES
ncbi:MAG: TIGR01620 family protein [Pseudomonadota bacterium]